MSKSFAYAALVMFAISCDGASRATIEGDGSVKQPDARPDTPAKDAGIDLNGKPPPVTTVKQGPVTFIVTNRSTEPRYVRWNAPFTKLLRFERLTASGSVPVSFEQPFCTPSCSEVPSNGSCLCMDCAAPAPAMKLLRPGESAHWLWSGKRYLVDNNDCECGCWYGEDPEAGRYEVLVDAFGAIRCDSCTPDQEGVIWMAEPEGDALTSSVEFAVVTPKTRIEIPLH